MSKVIFVMAMSLDGFVNDRHGAVDSLYADFTSLDDSDLMKDMVNETGAVLMGRRSFEMAGDPDWYAGNYEFQRPIFLSQTGPDKHPNQTSALTFTFVNRPARRADESEQRCWRQASHRRRWPESRPPTPAHGAPRRIADRDHAHPPRQRLAAF